MDPLKAEDSIATPSTSLALSGSDVDEEPEELLHSVNTTFADFKMEKKKKSRRTPSSSSFEAWLDRGDDVVEDVADERDAPILEAPAEGDGDDDEALAREVESKSSALAASPEGRPDVEALRLCAEIEGLKETLSREECVGLQRHQGEYLLQQGQDLLAQRRAQSAMDHATSLAPSREESPRRDIGRRREGGRRSTATAPMETEEDFLARAKAVAAKVVGSGVSQNHDTASEPTGVCVVYDNEAVRQLCSLVECFLARGLRDESWSFGRRRRCRWRSLPIRTGRRR